MWQWGAQEKENGKNLRVNKQGQEGSGALENKMWALYTTECNWGQRAVWTIHSRKDNLHILYFMVVVSGL